MDETLRTLQRRAAVSGDPADARALAAALGRLGRDALRYTGPLPPARRGHRGSRQVDRAETAVSRCYDRRSETRRQATQRAFSKRRRRRANRRVGEAVARDWDRWD